MKDDFRFERGNAIFWEQLGLDSKAAQSAAMCFPEAWYEIRKWWSSPTLEALPSELRDCSRDKKNRNEFMAEEYVERCSKQYCTCAWHPAFWYAQGYNFDEMARNAVAANAMMNLDGQANKPPEASNPVPTAMLALLASQQKQLPPPDPRDFFDVNVPYDEPPPPVNEVNPPEPFDPAQFPRLHR